MVVVSFRIFFICVGGFVRMCGFLVFDFIFGVLGVGRVLDFCWSCRK